MGVLVTYNRRPEDLPEEIATTVVAIAEIAGKSINTIYNGLSLLKLPEGTMVTDFMAQGPQICHHNSRPYWKNLCSGGRRPLGTDYKSVP